MNGPRANVKSCLCWTLTLIISLSGRGASAQERPKELTVPKDGLQIDGTVKRDDPKVEAQLGPRFKPLLLPAKVYLVKLSAKHNYRIDMIAADQKRLDAFLVIQGQDGKQLAFDDDSGDGLNARLFFSPPKDGMFKVFGAAL